MHICLDNMPVTGSYKDYQDFVDIYFWIVMALQFNIGIYEKGVMIEDRFVIGKLYLTTWFPLDFVSNFPFESVIT